LVAKDRKNGESISTSRGFAKGRAWREIGKNRGISMEVRSQIVDRRAGAQNMHIRR